MKYILTLIFVLFLNFAQGFDVIDDVAQAFKLGNSKELAKYFSSTIDLDILDKEDTYSSSEAENVLKYFFQKHQPTAAKVIHKVTSKVNYRLGVVLLTTSKGDFRISYELKNNDGKFLINQIRIEENKS